MQFDFGTAATFIFVSVALATLLAKVIQWTFRTSVTLAIKELSDRVLKLETERKLFWDVAEQRALETIHHSDQPMQDALIEKFQQKKMTDQELTQFVERLHIIADDDTRKDQQPAARLLLYAAEEEQKQRVLMGSPRTGTIGTSHAERAAENVEAGKQMAQESLEAAGGVGDTVDPPGKKIPNGGTRAKPKGGDAP